MAVITYIKESEFDGKAQLYVDNDYLESSTFRVDENIHAIQWNGKSGEIEYNDGSPNKIITDISSFDFEKKFATKKQSVIDAEAKAEADRKAAMTYKDKREAEYQTIGDQLDMIYHAGEGGDAFQKAIKAVKDKYPKG